MSADDLATVADYIFNGDPNDELGKARAEAAYTANHLGIVLDELAASQAENARLREALERIATWSKYRAASTGFDEDPSSANDPLVEAYERGANDMVDTLAPIASAALTQGQET